MVGSKRNERQIVLSRELAFPRERVFAAWTQPEHIAHWWGPDGFTNTVHTMDVRAGGSWRFVMHGPDGSNYPNRIVYTEVDPPACLVYQHGGDNEPFVADFHVTVRFEATASGTLLTLTMEFATAAACEKVKSFGAVEGGRQTLARLADHLAAMPA
ncbi:SRPBCC family protein [Chitinolyticbacter meiyuanensis]|uniref:SRPBCC family protein n=1 Tax=Chitinolyticbacter meiyuanensis TaxID=682798 RepID=UPI0011E5A27D|nr:SRPBCC family protein [Chitinolyticbacter meiyuanensis]